MLLLSASVAQAIWTGANAAKVATSITAPKAL